MNPTLPEFDVFLSHNSADNPIVEILARKLRAARLKVWLDKWSLVPGEPWQEALERGLDCSRTVVIAIGPAGIGPWQNEEMRSALDTRVHKRGYRVIPLLLPGADLQKHPLPRFLSRLAWVDFRRGVDDADALGRLLAGIRGQTPKPDDVGAPPSQSETPLQGETAPVYNATLHGSGGIAQGPGAVAAGAGGVAIGGNVKENIIVTGGGNVVGGGRHRGENVGEEGDEDK